MHVVHDDIACDRALYVCALSVRTPIWSLVPTIDIPCPPTHTLFWNVTFVPPFTARQSSVNENYHIDLDAEGDRRMDAPWLCTELFCMMTLLAFEIPKPSVLCPGFIGRELGFVYD
jgi:hypothetical protein